MKIIFSGHALFEIRRRQIDRNLVVKLIEKPAQILQAPKGRVVFQTKYFDPIIEREMLLRAIGKESDDTFYVVTAYKR